LYVEVKRTRSTGEEVQLTPNEEEHARAHGDKSILFVVHSVKVSGMKNPAVHGGELRVVQPFSLNSGVLRPRGYIFGLPKSIAVTTVFESRPERIDFEGSMLGQAI